MNPVEDDEGVEPDFLSGEQTPKEPRIFELEHPKPVVVEARPASPAHYHPHDHASEVKHPEVKAVYELETDVVEDAKEIKASAPAVPVVVAKATTPPIAAKATPPTAPAKSTVPPVQIQVSSKAAGVPAKAKTNGKKK
jgi:hypothetical protein